MDTLHHTRRAAGLGTVSLPTVEMERHTIPERIAIGLSIERLYRAHVTPAWPGRPERVAFVEAISGETAAKKIRKVVAALEHAKPCDVVVYGCRSADELLKEGQSGDPTLRLFEVSRRPGDARPAYAEQALFLLDEPAPLTRAWAQIRAREVGS